jgi:hypothetical protein
MPVTDNVRLALLVVGLGAVSVAGANATPCDELAAKARALPDAAWANGAEALKSFVQLRPAPGPMNAEETALSKLPAITKALSADNWTVTVQHLRGTTIYAASSVQGTLHCQQIVFLQRSERGAATMIPPPRVQEPDDLCWTSFAYFGDVLGQPAFITRDSLSKTSSADTIEVVFRRPSGWSRGCGLKLTYRFAYEVTERFCGDADVCKAAEARAPSLAAAGKPSADVAAFSKRALDLYDVPQFQTFGAKPKTEFPDYSNVDYVPLKLGGQDYVAAVGIGGVGWREIGDTLISVFRPEGSTLKPLAGVVVARSIVGLSGATAYALPRPREPGRT